MIRNDLKRLLDQKGITPYKLHQQAGIHKATALKLYHESDYIPRPDVMEKLAETYGWQPGWYITWVPSDVINACLNTTSIV